MKLHPRYHIVAKARNKLSEFVLDQMSSSDLTPGEIVQNLLQVAIETNRFVVRWERHGDYAKKADEAAAAEEHPAVEIVRQIIYASDGCQGHRGCTHSMKPWQEARALLNTIDAEPESDDDDD
jgi:hypothetical protein